MRTDRRMVRALAALAALAVAAGLTGCGGGGGGGDITPPDSGDVLPATVMATVKAFQEWMTREGIARDNDTAEPLSLGTAMPPEADTAEPVAVR